NKHLSSPPPRMSEFAPELNLSQELEAVIQTALAKDPEHRHASMSEFAQALVNTPESRAFGSSRLSGVPDLVTGRFIPSPGSETAAQFHTHGAHSAATLGAASANTAPSATQLEGTRSSIASRPSSSMAPVALA